MPVIRQKWVTRQDVQAHPDRLYLFGDNCRRRGMGGQADAMRGEPNAHGVRTKFDPSMAPDAFFSDSFFPKIKVMIDEDLARARRWLRNGGTVVIPEDGLGTGLSQMPERAPRCFAYLEEQLDELEDIVPAA